MDEDLKKLLEELQIPEDQFEIWFEEITKLSAEQLLNDPTAKIEEVVSQAFKFLELKINLYFLVNGDPTAKGKPIGILDFKKEGKKCRTKTRRRFPLPKRPSN